MTNPKQKIIVVILSVILLGLLVYNISNPYVKDESDDTAYTGLNERDTQYIKAFGTNKETTSDEGVNSYEKNDNDKSSAEKTEDETYYNEPQKSQNEIWLEQYRGNSLKNGAQPYHDLYGYNSTKGNSKIEIKASSSSDVLVMVKNQNGDVVKHVYIRKGMSASVTLFAGTYQAYFVYGESWCPEKEAPNGALGYFLENVSISKDYPQNIPANRILQYTLYQVSNGNFTPLDSNSSEAF